MRGIQRKLVQQQEVWEDFVKLDKATQLRHQTCQSIRAQPLELVDKTHSDYPVPRPANPTRSTFVRAKRFGRKTPKRARRWKLSRLQSQVKDCALPTTTVTTLNRKKDVTLPDICLKGTHTVTRQCLTRKWAKHIHVQVKRNKPISWIRYDKKQHQFKQPRLRGCNH